MDTYENFNLGTRVDGTYKGPGFAAIDTPYTGLMTEYSLGPTDTNYPMIFKGISPIELMAVENSTYTPEAYWDNNIWNVVDWATYLASLRKMQGLPMFWQPSDGAAGLNYIPLGE